MDDLFRPMLAKDADLTKLTFPLLASAKLDGVRAVVRDGVVYSRSNKPIPNKAVQDKFNGLEYFDGELIFGDPTSKSCYRDTVSVVMSHDKPADDINYYVFDHVGQPEAYYRWRKSLLEPYSRGYSDVHMHPQVRCNDLAAVLAYEEICLDLGYEGLILRSPDAPYKMGRSTVNEGYLLKLKRFTDDEAVIVGFEERMENTNEKTTNELGRGQRSSHAAGMVGRGDLGALLLCTKEGIQFACGTGFDDAERARIWNNQAHFMSKLVKYKHFTVGAKDAPRYPVFLGFRDPIDM